MRMISLRTSVIDAMKNSQNKLYYETFCANGDVLTEMFFNDDDYAMHVSGF